MFSGWFNGNHDGRGDSDSDPNEDSRNDGTVRTRRVKGLSRAHNQELRQALKDVPPKKDVCGDPQNGLMLHQRQLKSVITPSKMARWGVGCVLVCWAPGTGKTAGMAAVAENYMQPARQEVAEDEVSPGPMVLKHAALFDGKRKSTPRGTKVVVCFPFNTKEWPRKEPAKLASQEEEFWRQLYNSGGAAHRLLVGYGKEDYGFLGWPFGGARARKKAKTAISVKPISGSEFSQWETGDRERGVAVSFKVLYQRIQANVLGFRAYCDEVGLPYITDISGIGTKAGAETLKTPYVLIMDEAHELITLEGHDKSKDTTQRTLSKRIADADPSDLVVLFSGTPVQEDEDEAGAQDSSNPRLLDLALGTRDRNILVSWNMDTSLGIYPRSQPPMNDLLSEGVLWITPRSTPAPTMPYAAYMAATSGGYRDPKKAGKSQGLPWNKGWVFRRTTDEQLTVLASLWSDERLRGICEYVIRTSRVYQAAFKCCIIMEDAPARQLQCLLDWVIHAEGKMWHSSHTPGPKASGVLMYDGLDDLPVLNWFAQAPGPTVLILTNKAGAQGLNVRRATHMILGDVAPDGVRPKWTEIQQRAARALRMCAHGDDTGRATVQVRVVAVGPTAAQQSQMVPRSKTLDAWRLWELEVTKRLTERKLETYRRYAFNLLYLD